MPFMKHPDVDGHIAAADSQVQVFEKSGWTLVDLVDLPKTELIRLADEAGAPISRTATKAEIVEAIESIQAQEV